ncbi:MAG TPA: malectin domain-containing carbohydrate-binding protein [Bryobacteraceae bacterium]
MLQRGVFAAGSNAAKLLRYVCERHFDKPGDPITEYEVAVQGLGRRQNFDSQKDSIVRVEAHRVRRRLQEFYATEGASHTLRITLPRGQYHPEFMSAADPVETVEAAALEPLIVAGDKRIGRQWRRWAIAAAVAAGVGMLAIAKLAPFGHGDEKPLKQTAAPAAVDTVEGVHLLAGRMSGFHVDRTGTRWSGDAWYTGGSAGSLRYYSLAQAEDPAVYESARTGKDFSYDIPLRPGVYELRLMLAEAADRVPIMGEIGEGARSMQVFANGVRILPPKDGRHRQALDIIADAGGTDTADVKVFRDISPADDGKLHLRFVGRKQEALVNAIEIVPGIAGRMRPLRWRAGDSPYTDQAGNVWSSDHYFRGGRFSRFHSPVSGTKDPGLYQGERFGSFTYSVPVVSGDSYTVTVHFAENYFGAMAPPLNPARIFNLYVNHAQLLRDFDVTKAAGGPARVVTRTFRGVRPNPFDKIVLCFEPVTEFAIVNAIEVEDEGR